MNRFCLSTLLLVSVASAVPAQESLTAATDSSGVTLEQRTAHNWFVSLMRKIARKSDAPAADSTVADVSAADGASEVVAEAGETNAKSFKSKKDSLAWASARMRAENAKGYRVVVDVFDKTLRVIDRDDTLRVASVATASNATLEFGSSKWRFETPRGLRTVLKKEKEPVWTPPDWHFAEVANEHHLKLARLQRGRTVTLKDGTRLKTVGDEVGIIRPGTTEFVPMARDEHIVFDNTIFIPPLGTKHRQFEGELGHYRLDLGDGYMLHGTPYTKSIGTAVTHGCVRMHDDDIEWLFENIPVGTKVYIY